LLFLKPNFLGARSPEDLHSVFRQFSGTKKYDEDAVVQKIRLAAGLTPTIPGTAINVRNFVASLTGTANHKRKIIVDMSGEAHTFALLYEGSTWKRFDNDNPDGSTDIKYGTKAVACTWELP
jgi:hypothetical protein